MVDSPRLPFAAPQRTPASAKAALSSALPAVGQQKVATFLFQEGSQGTFALGSRRFHASLQGAPSLKPGDQLLVEGDGEGKPLHVRELLRREGQSLNQAALDRLWRGAAGRDQSPRAVNQQASQSTFSDPRLQGLAQALRALGGQLPALSLNALSANSLQSALEESGIFFEGKLKAGQAPARDQRGVLLKLRGEIQEALAQRRESSTPSQQSQPPRTGAAHGQAAQVQASAARGLGSELRLPQLTPASRPEGRRKVADAPGKVEGRGASREAPLLELERALAEDTAKLQRLERQIDQGLARLRLFQHHSLSQPPDQPSWLLELPIAFADKEQLWQVQIRREAPRPNQPEGAARWTARLAVEPGTANAIEGHITLEGIHLSGRLWCAAQKTEARLGAALGGLRTHLAEQGFVVDQFGVHRGEAPAHLRVAAVEPKQ
ncbi:MAG: flagellar hook-length control protein FliK [Pseudomonadales bacterium]|nr:flagellar hook-length control protein FliK [Pseudomonadales bacterium]